MILFASNKNGHPTTHKPSKWLKEDNNSNWPGLIDQTLVSIFGQLEVSSLKQICSRGPYYVLGYALPVTVGH